MGRKLLKFTSRTRPSRARITPIRNVATSGCRVLLPTGTRCNAHWPTLPSGRRHRRRRTSRTRAPSRHSKRPLLSALARQRESEMVCRERRAAETLTPSIHVKGGALPRMTAPFDTDVTRRGGANLLNFIRTLAFSRFITAKQRDGSTFHDLRRMLLNKSSRVATTKKPWSASLGQSKRSRFSTNRKSRSIKLDPMSRRYRTFGTTTLSASAPALIRASSMVFAVAVATMVQPY